MVLVFEREILNKSTIMNLQLKKQPNGLLSKIK